MRFLVSNHRDDQQDYVNMCIITDHTQTVGTGESLTRPISSGVISVNLWDSNMSNEIPILPNTVEFGIFWCHFKLQSCAKFFTSRSWGWSWGSVAPQTTPKWRLCLLPSETRTARRLKWAHWFCPAPSPWRRKIPRPASYSLRASAPAH